MTKQDQDRGSQSQKPNHDQRQGQQSQQPGQGQKQQGQHPDSQNRGRRDQSQGGNADLGSSKR